MPELPDLEIICEVLNRHLPGRRIETAEVLRPVVVRALRGEDLARELAGARFGELRRRGKFLLFGLDGERVLVLNPMLSGRLHYCDAGERRHARTVLILTVEGGRQLRYHDQDQMGKVYLATTNTLDRIPTLAEHGPDALDPGLTPGVFAERLRRHPGEIKNTLRNHRFVAGIGNAYADEILFRAGIYPFRKRTSLSADEVVALHQAMRETLTEATGVVRAEMGEQIDQKIRDFLCVHGKGRLPCPHCGEPVSEIRANGFLTNFCRRCQPGGMFGGMRGSG